MFQVVIPTSLKKQHYNVRMIATYLVYLRQHHPHIDWNVQIKSLGIEPEYFKDEGHWVSVEFARSFIDLAKELTNDPQLTYKVGRFSLSPEGLGNLLYTTVRYALSLEGIFNNLWKFSAQFNKVVDFKMVERQSGKIKMLLIIRKEILTSQEFHLFKSAMSDVLGSIRGYYSAIPLIKGGKPAEVFFNPVDELTTEIVIHYQVLNHWISAKNILIYGLGGSVAVLSGVVFGLWGILTSLSFYTAGLLITSLVKQKRRLGVLVDEANQQVAKRNDQYAELLETRNQLDQQLQASLLLSKISEILIYSKAESFLLEEICQELSVKLGLDQAAIFIADEAKENLLCRGLYLKDKNPNLLGSKIKYPISAESPFSSEISKTFVNRKSVFIEKWQDFHVDLESQLSASNIVSDILAAYEPPDPLLIKDTWSICCVPIISEIAIYGVLQVKTKLNNRALRTGDLKVLETVARQVAVAIEKERFSNTYKKFVPRELISLLGFQNITDVKANIGAEFNMSVLFADIRKFTSLSEEMTPMEALSYLNDYFSNLGPVFSKHQGVIDKFLGDGIMVLFRDPAEAVRAAVEFQTELSRYNERNRLSDKNLPVSVGIGIHHGKVVLGTIGYDERMGISVVSDCVNIASRIESLTKNYGVDIICTDVVARSHQPNKENQKVRIIGYRQLRGRSGFVPIYEIFGHLSEMDVYLRAKNAPLIARLVEGLMNSRPPEPDTLQLLFEASADDPVVKFYQHEYQLKTAKAS
jgi:class 3 adenylate cyclase